MGKVHVQGSPSRPGSEAEMVNSFVDTFFEGPGGLLNRTIFVEPSLGTARPDIVIVDWDRSVTLSWPEERKFLVDTDLRLAHLLYTEGPLPQEMIQVFFPRQTKGSLARLQKAKLIESTHKKWRLCDFQSLFAVRHITALEAKISALSRAIEQAYFNTWFASESYVLSALRRVTNSIIERAESFGVGLWAASEKPCQKPLLPPKKYGLPQSYASWVFNELAWKTSLGTDDEC
jgi:hypothetical protein